MHDSDDGVAATTRHDASSTYTGHVAGILILPSVNSVELSADEDSIGQ